MAFAVLAADDMAWLVVAVDRFVVAVGDLADSALSWTNQTIDYWTFALGKTCRTRWDCCFLSFFRSCQEPVVPVLLCFPWTLFFFSRQVAVDQEKAAGVKSATAWRNVDLEA